MNKIFSLVALSILLVGSVSGQTLLHEGRAGFIRTTPAVLEVPNNVVGYNLNASYSHRLSERFDVTGAFGHSGSLLSVGASVGYTKRIAEKGWGFRSGMAFTSFHSPDSWSHVRGRGILSAMIFRQVDLFRNLQIFPTAQLSSDVLSRSAFPNLSASIGGTSYISVWRELRVFVAPSYRVDLTPVAVDRGRNVLVAFGVQLSLPR